MTKTLYQARDILDMTEDQLWSFYNLLDPQAKFELEFDDVIITTDIAKTVPMWYFWDLHRLYPKTPLLAEHHTEGRHFDAKSVPKLLTVISRAVINTYGEDNIDYALLGKQCYEVSNRLYNAVSYRMGAYVDTVDMRDIANVYYHPRMVEIRDKCLAERTPKAINELYDSMEVVMSEEGFLPGNSLVETVKMKNASMKQVNQCIGLVGFRTDIDSSMFPKPVMDSFASGLKDFNEFIIESRSASKALLFQKDPIRTTEYYNRRTQLIDQSIRRLVPGDCGTDKGLPWEMQPGDSKALAGKYYITEHGLRYIDPSSRETAKLTGQTILLRSPIYCRHIAHGAVCEKCLGRIAKTIPYGSNLGHLAAFTMCAKITQAVLSTKHHDGSTEVDAIALDNADRKYIKLDEKRFELIKLQRKWAKQKDLTLILPVDNVTNLTQAMQTTNLRTLSIFRISSLYKVGFKYQVDDVEIVDWVTVSGPSRPSALTHFFLEHIRRHGYHQEDAKFLEVPLAGWDVDYPMFELPQKQLNMLDFMSELSNMFEGSPKGGIKKGLDPNRPEDVMSYLRTILEYSSQHVAIPFYCLEITADALMVRSLADNDYRLPAYDGNREFATKDMVMKNRSIGAALAYEEQGKLLTSARSFDPHHRVAHPMDALFYPNVEPEFWERDYGQKETK